MSGWKAGLRSRRKYNTMGDAVANGDKKQRNAASKPCNHEASFLAAAKSILGPSPSQSVLSHKRENDGRTQPSCGHPLLIASLKQVGLKATNGPP